MKQIKPSEFYAVEDETKKPKIGLKIYRKYRFKLERSMTYFAQTIAQKNFNSGKVLVEAWPLSYLDKTAF